MKLSKAVECCAGPLVLPQASPGTGEITPAQLMDCFIGHGYAKVLAAKSLYEEIN